MRKDKCRLSGEVKSFVKWQLEHYPANLRELEERRACLTELRALDPWSMGTTGMGRPTEGAAVKLCTDRYLRELERSVKAVDYVVDKLNPTDRALIDLVYWRGTHSVEGAAMKLNISASAAYRHINGIVTRIAMELGYIPVL